MSMLENMSTRESVIAEITAAKASDLSRELGELIKFYEFAHD